MQPLPNYFGLLFSLCRINRVHSDQTCTHIELVWTTIGIAFGVKRSKFKVADIWTYNVFLRGALVTCTHAVSRYRVGSVSLCVCLHRMSKLLVGNRCYLVVICPMVNARSGWKLMTFDLDL